MLREKRNLAGLYDFLTCGSSEELDGTFKTLPDSHLVKHPYHVFWVAEPRRGATS